MCVCVQVRGKSNRFNQKTLAFTRWQKFFTIGCCSSSDALYLLVIYARPRVLAVDNWQAHPRLIYIYIYYAYYVHDRENNAKSRVSVYVRRYAEYKRIECNPSWLKSKPISINARIVVLALRVIIIQNFYPLPITLTVRYCCKLRLDFRPDPCARAET